VSGHGPDTQGTVWGRAAFVNGRDLRDRRGLRAGPDRNRGGTSGIWLRPRRARIPRPASRRGRDSHRGVSCRGPREA